MALETYRKTELDKIIADYGTDRGGDDEDYDPYQHREVPHGTNFAETLVQVLNASLGTGLLALPLAFYHGGWVNGLIFTFFITFICTYGIHIMIRSQYKLCKRLKVPYLTYRIAMRAALLSGPIVLTPCADLATFLVDSFMIIYETGVCCACIVFVAKNTKQLFDDWLEEEYAIEIYILCLVLPFMLIISVPNMKWLAPLSLLSNILTFVTLGIMFHYIFAGLPDFSDMNYFGDTKGFSRLVGTVLFAIAAMGVVTTVEKNMTSPHQFTGTCGVLNIAMSIIPVIYAAMGFFGYWRHPFDITPSMTLTIDKKKVEAKVILVSYVIVIYISCAVNGMVAVDIVWNQYLVHHYVDNDNARLWEYVIRYSVVTITFIFAFLLPLLAEIIAIVGSLCIPFLEIIFPAVVDLCVRWPENLGRRHWILLITDIGMMIIGLIFMFFGTSTALYDMHIILIKRKRMSSDNF